MTVTLGSLFKGGKVYTGPQPTPQPLNIPQLAHTLLAALTASGQTPALPTGTLLSSMTAWTEQDDDAHDTCDALVACRSPLHPGPCKGWKHTLHQVSPGAWHQLEGERVRKANERRVKRIADLKAQGKPIPRHLLAEIKPKPAPAHPAHAATPVPLHQVNQKADLAGGQAHKAGQSVSQAAGVKVNTPALPLGPKGKKPSVSGRGPAFVITQPKVTDTYKLDKAAKITPQEWASLSDADKATIRNELTAIKARGFDPQQKKADELLLKLHSGSKPGTAPSFTPGGTITTPSGKTHPVLNPVPNLSGQTIKQAKANGGLAQAAQAVAQNAKAAGHKPVVQQATTPGKVTLGQATKPATPQLADSIKAHQAQRAQNAPGGQSHGRLQPAPAGVTTAAGRAKAAQDPAAKLTPAARVFIYNRMSKADFDTLDDAAKKQVFDDLDNQATKGSLSRAKEAKLLQDRFGAPPSTAPAPTSSTVAPAAPLAPGTAPHIQHAAAVANRTAPKAQMAKTHIDAYGKLSKADFDALPDKQQNRIRDDLANAKAKFLDPKKQQDAADLLDRFGSRKTVPAAPASPASTSTKIAATHIKEGDDITVKGQRMTVGSTWYESRYATPGAQRMTNMVGFQPDGSKDPADRVWVAAHVPVEKHTPSAKGYSDPQNEAVKAVSAGTVKTDDVLKRVGALTPDQVKALDDTDRKQVLYRLAFVATHPQATAEQKAKATAFGRIINSGSPAQGLKRDHVASLAELHADEQKTPSLHPAVGEALKAADQKLDTATTPDRVKALGGLSKAQFDGLKPEEQRKILDALQNIHAAYGNHPEAEKALVAYTGLHPGVHRLKQAEADYKAGKITAEQLRSAWLTARVQAPTKGTSGSPGHLVQAEAQRIAEGNPSLPLPTRASMIENSYYGKHNGVYEAVQQASNEFNFKGAPRFSQFDMKALFRPSADDLKHVHPIQAEAVQELRKHAISSGLGTGSPWSSATKDQFADAVLGLDHSNPTISDEKLKEFRAYPAAERDLVHQVLANRLAGQTNSHAQTQTYITLRQVEDKAPLKPEVEAALHAAAERFPGPTVFEAYRKLDPADYKALPTYVQSAITDHLDELQRTAARGGPSQGWTVADNPFRVMPASLEAHLNGDRHTYADRSQRNAADLANYGTDIITPESRASVYQQVTGPQFDAMDIITKQKIEQDLDRIAKDSSLPLDTRYTAQFTKDLGHRTPNNPTSLNVQQLVAVAGVDPHPATSLRDSDVFTALSNLDKAYYDDLALPFREAIDARIKGFSGSDQQFLTAKFHPSMAANNPSGLAPTTVQANVPPNVQEALDTIYGVHLKSHTMAHQLKTYGALRGHDFSQLNPQEQNHLLADLSYIETTAKGPSAAKAKLLIDRFTPAGTPAGQAPTPAIIPPANSVAGQVRYATPLKGLEKAADTGKSGDGWITTPGGKRVWGAHGAAGLLIKHVDPNTGEERYLMVQRGPAISDPGKWTFPGGAIDSKETPHQGAARETIEELGLKDDQLKNALVHGDHTFTIPGSTWKYTTVAAQVDKQFKPNLSTAHARAETSDAKWMTIDEIRALDKSGKLHAPIANGLLEKNVVSLYPPKGAGQTLGQAARPGPVTKRLGRLAVPSGGRQAPATFNAWPHAHKKSTGKDLVADKAAIDTLRQDVKKARGAYDGKTADGRLAAIGAMQGFDDTPTVASKKEIDRLLATGDYIEVFRGVKGAYGGPSAAKINEDMRSGPAWYGRGIFGNGYYLATQRSVATQYSDHTKNSVVRMLIPKSAVIHKYKDVQKEARANSSRHSKAKGKYEDGTLYDAGRWAAAKGADGIQIDHDTVNDTGGWARHVAKPGQPAFNWLNRSVLIIQEAD